MAMFAYSDRCKKMVVESYRQAVGDGQPSKGLVKRIAARFGIPLPTAALWIRKAKKGQSDVSA